MGKQNLHPGHSVQHKPLSPADYAYLYMLTREAVPLDFDCGQLCGRACCQPGKKENLGVYLFPGEEIMFSGNEDWCRWELHNPRHYRFPASWREPVHFLLCRRQCEREKRPLACRFYPLAPHTLRGGTLLLIYDPTPLPYRCPIVDQQIPLRPDFIATVSRAWLFMLRDRRIYDLVVEDSRYRERHLHSAPVIVWQKKIF